MNEWRRLLSNRKRRITFICIPLLCTVLFFYQKSDGDFGALLSDGREYQVLVDTYRDSSSEEIEAVLYISWGVGSNEERLFAQAEHQETYEEYLNRVQKQASDMQASSLFNSNRNSFTYRNIVKTAEDFAECAADDLYFGNYRAVQDWLEFGLTDWAFLLAMVLLVMAFTEERQMGLSAIIRACPGGRGKLQGTRLGILMCYSAAITVLLYAVTLLISLCIDGGWGDLLYPVQSISAFRTCTVRISILEFIVQFLGVKTACGFLLGLLTWFILSFLNQVQISWMLTAAGLAVEYLLFTLIPAQSIFSPLRYVNVFSYVFTSELYTQYTNINFLEFPVQNRALLLWLLAALTVVLGIATVWVLAKRHPFGNKDLLGKWLNRWNCAADLFRRHLGILGYEWYKLLFLTAGGLFLVLGILLTRDIRCNSGAYNRMEDIVYRQYVAQILGPVTQSTFDYLSEARQALEESDMNTAEFEIALDTLDENISALPEGAWLVDETAFLNIYGSDAWRTQRQNALTAMIFLVACLSSLFACEESGDVRKILRATPAGGQRLFGIKYALALSLAVIVWLAVFGREWLAAGKLLGELLLEAPCSSLEIIQAWPGTVGTFLTRLYSSKLLGMVIVSNLCVFFGERSKDFEKAFLVSGAVLLLPAAVYSFGVDAAAFTPMAFLADGNILLTGPWLLFPWLILSLAAIAAANWHWCRQ